MPGGAPRQRCMGDYYIGKENDDMDIAALSTTISRGTLGVNVSMALMEKVLETAEETGEALTQMMESAAIPGLGEYIDIRV